MRSRKRINETVLVFDKGEEVVSTLAAFAKQNQIAGGHFTAIGALSDARFEHEKEFTDQVNELVNVLSLIGDIVLDEGEPAVEAYVVVGLKNGAATGGRLLEAHVLPTLELVLRSE